MSATQIGSNNPAWKGGITPINVMERTSPEGHEWRTKVFVRDNYTCQLCGSRSGQGTTVKLQAHHLLDFCNYKDLRLDIDNGITLCVSCHRGFHRKNYDKREFRTTPIHVV